MQLMNDNVFLSRTAFMCEDCYLYVTMTSEAGGKLNKEIKQKDLYGTQNLNPGKIIKT